MLAFFAVASSKLATYLVPALPAFALLLGAWVDATVGAEALARIVRRISYGFAAVGVAMFVAIAAYGSSTLVLDEPDAIRAELFHEVIASLVVTALALCIGSACALRRRRALRRASPC